MMNANNDHYRPILNAEETEMKQEWSGEGMPPVGTVCECSYEGADQGFVTVKYIGTVFCVLLNHAHGEEQCGRVLSYKFKPILTARDRWIEAVNKEWGGDGRFTPEFCEDVFGAIYDAGLAKLPEQSK